MQEQTDDYATLIVPTKYIQVAHFKAQQFDLLRLTCTKQIKNLIQDHARSRVLPSI
jgi:hypothetical protein